MFLQNDPVSFAQRRTRRASIRKELLKSVVKVFTVKTEPDYTMPWQLKRQTISTASGFIISGRRIVTNAHAIDYQTSVRVRRHGSSDKYVARVVGVGHQCDLAVLTVQDDSFWDDDCLELGDIPHLHDTVTVIGYPTGGDNISVTKGVVSRIEETYYSHGAYRLLAIQIDAAINSGNSGGPVFMGEQVIGVAFETLVNADNIGYIIPIPVLTHFLQDIETHNGAYRGFPDIGIQIQPLESDVMRKALGMNQEDSGIMINKASQLMHAGQVLRKGDVVLEIDGIKIGNDATIPFREHERVSWRCALLDKFVGDDVEMKVMRENEKIQTKVTVEVIPYLVPAQLYDKMPTYFVHAGLVFQPLTQPYLVQEWGKDWRQKAPIRYLDATFYGKKEFVDQEVVILSQILSSDFTVAFKKYEGYICKKLNGVEIRNMSHLVDMVDSNTSPFLNFELDNDWMIILDAAEAKSKNRDILRLHNIMNDKSSDLMITSSQEKLASMKIHVGEAKSEAFANYCNGLNGTMG
jgi:S1-C subfamily serine protease